MTLNFFLGLKFFLGLNFFWYRKELALSVSMFGEEGSVMAKVRTEAKGSRDLLIANLLGKPELSTSEISKIVGCSQSIQLKLQLH